MNDKRDSAGMLNDGPRKIPYKDIFGYTVNKTKEKRESSSSRMG